MSLLAMGQKIATESQKLTYTSAPPDVCLIVAPPPPAGPMGIPTPFPITTNSGSVDSDAADGVTHKDSKTMIKDTVASGIKGNEAGVGQLPPGQPHKDVLTGVNMKNASGIVGCPTVKLGGGPAIFVGSPGLGNQS